MSTRVDSVAGQLSYARAATSDPFHRLSGRDSPTEKFIDAEADRSWQGGVQARYALSVHSQSTGAHAVNVAGSEVSVSGLDDRLSATSSTALLDGAAKDDPATAHRHEVEWVPYRSPKAQVRLRATHAEAEPDFHATRSGQAPGVRRTTVVTTITGAAIEVGLRTARDRDLTSDGGDRHDIGGRLSLHHDGSQSGSRGWPNQLTVDASTRPYTAAVSQKRGSPAETGGPIPGQRWATSLGWIGATQRGYLSWTGIDGGSQKEGSGLPSWRHRLSVSADRKTTVGSIGGAVVGEVAEVAAPSPLDRALAKITATNGGHQVHAALKYDARQAAISGMPAKVSLAADVDVRGLMVGPWAAMPGFALARFNADVDPFATRSAQGCSGIEVRAMLVAGLTF